MKHLKRDMQNKESRSNKIDTSKVLTQMNLFGSHKEETSYVSCLLQDDGIKDGNREMSCILDLENNEMFEGTIKIPLDSKDIVLETAKQLSGLLIEAGRYVRYCLMDYDIKSRKYKKITKFAQEDIERADKLIVNI